MLGGGGIPSNAELCNPAYRINSNWFDKGYKNQGTKGGVLPLCEYDDIKITHNKEGGLSILRSKYVNNITKTGSLVMTLADMFHFTILQYGYFPKDYYINMYYEYEALKIKDLGICPGVYSSNYGQAKLVYQIPSLSGGEYYKQIGNMYTLNNITQKMHYKGLLYTVDYTTRGGQGSTYSGMYSFDGEKL